MTLHNSSVTNKQEISADPKKDVKIEDIESIYFGEDVETNKRRLEYLGRLQTRLESARIARNGPHPEWNNKNYSEKYQERLKLSHTFIEPKKNDDDVLIASGTVEQKLDSLLSHINNLNLDSEVIAFDREENMLRATGRALQSIIRQTKINEPESDNSGDEEKRIARQKELLIQGEVFIQEEWLKKFQTVKKLKGKFTGKIKGVEWSERLEKVFEGPSKNMLYGPNVYLGNITEFYIEKQPYIFAVINQDYNEAKKVYSKWDRWSSVNPGPLKSDIKKEEQNIYSNQWRLTDLLKNQVEIIFFYDQPNNEFQVMINGVLMLPISFPLSAVSPGGKYNIVKQVFRIVHHKWTYGDSFVSGGAIQQISALIDEMLKLFVLKTRSSFKPAYINTSGRVIDPKVLSAGRISMGIDPDALVPIEAGQVTGVTQGEVAVLLKLQELVDSSTVSNQFTGKQGKRTQTATETLELQRQAQKTLGLTIAVCALLEKKLDYLRLFNILANWFEPIGTKVVGIGDARKIIKTFRKVTAEEAIEGVGLGNRSVIVKDGDIPTSKEIRALERLEEKKSDKPMKIIFMNAERLKAAKLHWYLIVKPTEKESSLFSKLMFRELMADVISLINVGAVPNVEGLEEQLAQNWDKAKDKLFKTPPPQEQQGLSLSGAQGDSEKNVRSPAQELQAQGRGNQKLSPGAANRIPENITA